MRVRETGRFSICGVVAVVLTLAWVDLASAASVNFITWTSFPTYDQSYPVGAQPFTGTSTYGTSATGFIVHPVTSSTITVTYSGEVNSQSNVESPWFSPFFDATYTSPNVPTMPPNPSSYVALTGFTGGTNTLTFSEPISNLVMNIASLGGTAGVSAFNFNSTPVLLSSGQGIFGFQTIPLSISGNSLSGQEGNGTIQFDDSISSLSWTQSPAEYYSMITIGITSVAAVPEPSTYAMALAGLACGGYTMFRRRKRA